MVNMNKGITNPNWFKNAYPNHTSSIAVAYELKFGQDVIAPGNRIKIKNLRGEYLFRCVASPINGDRPWIDCISVDAGSWHSFPLGQLKELVKPKRSRRKKPMNA